MNMDIEELAIEKNEEVVKYISCLGNEMHVEGVFREYFSENGVVFIVESAISELVYNRKRPMSLKPGNVFVDMKKTLDAAVQIFAGIQKPEGIYGAIQMVLLVVLSIKDVMNVELPERSSEVLVVLNQNNGFVSWMEEEKLYNLVNEYDKLNNLAPMQEKDFFAINDFLSRYGVIEINDNKILMKERIFGKDFV